MVELSEAEFEAATERGRASLQAEPHAMAVRYDRDADRVIVDLVNGCTFAFPPRLAQGLEDAAPEALADIALSPAGTSLHWPALDVDFSVAGLMAGIFGTRAAMSRRAGQASSPAKAAAARTNGKKGGRPRRIAGL